MTMTHDAKVKGDTAIRPKTPLHGRRQRVSGMNCPVCEGFIPISIPQLLFDGGISCPHCGLLMTINRRQSTAAMDALKKVNDAMRKVKKTEKFRR